MDTTIKLKTFSNPYGTQKPQEATSRTVYADVDYASITAQVNAKSVGMSVSHQVIMSRYDYEEETHAEVDNKLYKIMSVGKAKNPDKIRILLSRG
jgi:Tfp pilus assembly protein PilX